MEEEDKCVVYTCNVAQKKKKKKKKKALFLINSCTADSGCALVNTELQFHQGR